VSGRRGLVVVVSSALWLARATAHAADAAPTSPDAASPDSPDAGAPEPPPAAPQAIDGDTPANADRRVAQPPPPAPYPMRFVSTPVSNPPSFAWNRRPGPDEWPIEYVLRPQTIPADTTRVELTTFAAFIDGDFIPSSGLQARYHDWVQVGGAFLFGVTDRVETSIFVPRTLCWSDGSPSVCDDYARVSGSGADVRFGVVRTHAVQLRLSTGFDVGLSDPLTLEVNLGARTKILFADRVALELALDVSKWLDPPVFYEDQRVGFWGATLDLNVQVTPHVLVWGDLEPNAPLDHIGEPRLEPRAGASWTFDNALDLGVRAGIYNVLPRHAWDLGLPGKFAALAMSFWL
jgi:hypothetical protein